MSLKNKQIKKGEIYSLIESWPFYFTPNFSYKILYNLNNNSDNDDFEMVYLPKHTLLMLIKKTRVENENWVQYSDKKFRSAFYVISPQGKLGCVLCEGNNTPFNKIEEN